MQQLCKKDGHASLLTYCMLFLSAGSRQGAGQRRLVGPDEVSRAAAMLAGGSGGSSEKVEAIRELPADQKVALIAAYQLAGKRWPESD